MFNLIVSVSPSRCDTEYYTFSAIENCIDLINISKATAIENKKNDITFIFVKCCINDITSQPKFILGYNVYFTNIYINSYHNKLLGLTLTEDLTTEILYDLFKKNNFSIDDDAMW